MFLFLLFLWLIFTFPLHEMTSQVMHNLWQYLWECSWQCSIWHTEERFYSIMWICCFPIIWDSKKNNNTEEGNPTPPPPFPISFGKYLFPNFRTSSSGAWVFGFYWFFVLQIMRIFGLYIYNEMQFCSKAPHPLLCLLLFSFHGECWITQKVL